MDEYFHNHVMGKASLSRNHEEKDKKKMKLLHIILNPYYFILVSGNPTTLL